MASREDTPEPGTSAASTSQTTPATPQDSSRENPACPECWDISTACSSSCQHCFCQLCLWDWSLGQAACPRCQRPTRHPYPQHVALYHEVQDRVYNSKARGHGHSRGCSGRFGQGRPWERRRRRSVRRPRHGRWRSGHSRGSDSPRRRGRQQRRVWEDTGGEGRAPRLERGVPASSRGSQARYRSRRSRSRRERSRGHRGWSRGRERSHSQDRSSRRDQDTRTGPHEHSARQRRRRSWNADDRHTPRPQHGVPSGRSERHRWEDSDSSGHQHRTRSRTHRTRCRSHRRGQDTQTSSERTVPCGRSRRWRRWRSWNADGGRAPRSQWDTPGFSGRSRSRAGRRDT